MERLTREELFMGAASYNCRGHEKDCDLNCPNEDSCGWLKEALEKLKQYEDLEEQGKLLKLPVLVGGTVWDNDFGKPYSYTVTGFSFGKIDDDEENDIEGLQMYYQNYKGSIRCSCAVSEIGKTVFLTQEEADAALEKMEESK